MASETTFLERRAQLRGVSRPSQLAFGVAILAVVSGCATYALLTGLTSYTPDRVGLIALLLVNLTLVLSLAALIGWRLARLWATRRSGRAGARLHARLVAWFSAIAVVPVIVVAIFAAVTLNLGLDAMFSSRVQNALGNAVNVAEVYAKEQQRSIFGDAYEIANGIQHDPQLFDEKKHVRAGFLFTKLGTLTQRSRLAGARTFSTARVMCWAPANSAPSGIPKSPARRISLRPAPDPSSSIPIPTPARSRALIQMQAMNDAYLQVVRVVDPQVFGYYQRTRVAVSGV